MKVVITHVNPDFDAAASAYAALKLHECDYIATCSSYEPNVDEYLKQEHFQVPVRRLKKKDIENHEKIELLVITDCKTKRRLGALAGIVDKADKIIIYDHHFTRPRDIPCDEEYIFETGATTTIIAEKIFENNVRLTADEASLLMLGIYEDTGLLSFNSTTPAEMKAAARLLEAGADMTLITDYVKRDLSKEQVFLMNELLMNMSFIRVSGISVALSFASVEKYIGEISYLAHRIKDMESLDSLFILVRTGERLILVGRSSADEVNALSICHMFEGGGHPTAASAIIKNMTLHEAMEKLKTVIKEEIHPAKTAKEIMNYPVKTVSYNDTFNKAKDLFMKYNLNIMPVVQEGRPIGIIGRKDILHGLKHGLDEDEVSSIMQIEFASVSPDAQYYEIEELMISGGHKMVVVCDDGLLKGVITRTDLIRMMHEEISKMPRFMQGHRLRMGLSKMRNIKSIIEDILPSDIIETLQNVGRLADELDYKVYIVGGIVRDILMRNKNDDIDIVVEGDAPKLAKRFAKKYGARVAVHSKFKTAVVIFKSGFRLDFATSRTEYYGTPAAAPEVEGASIRNDLYRRDFSINAMAVCLNGSEYGRLIDYFGGQKDIIDKKIRVLHSLSFVDDPSRGLRAVRFAVRFGFEVGPHTDKLLKHAVSLNLFERLAGQRLFLELKYILNGSRVEKAVKMLDSYRILKVFSEKITPDADMQRRLEYLERLLSWYDIQLEREIESYKARLCILFYQLKFPDMVKLAKRLEMPQKLKDDIVKSFLKLKKDVVALKRSSEPPPSRVAEIFENIDDEYVLAAGAVLGEDYENIIKNYLTRYKTLETDITGDDLIKLGLKPGKDFAVILEKVRNELLDGKIKTFDEQLQTARKTALELSGETEKN